MESAAPYRSPLEDTARLDSWRSNAPTSGMSGVQGAKGPALGNPSGIVVTFPLESITFRPGAFVASYTVPFADTANAPHTPGRLVPGRVWITDIAGSMVRRLPCRSPSTISRELRRNAATRCGRLDYRASTAQ